LEDFFAAVPTRIDRWQILLEAIWRIREAMRTGRPLVDGHETLELLKTFRKRTLVRASVSDSLDTLSLLERWRARRLMSVKKATPKVGVFGDFKIAATGMPTGTGLGWRITTTDQNTGLQHECFVNHGQIYHVQFQSSPPSSHQTPFVVGGRVKRIMASEKRAILQAVVGWS
jgi:hypothetical protein